MLVVLYKCLMHLLMNKWAVFHLVDILFSKIVEAELRGEVRNKAGYTIIEPPPAERQGQLSSDIAITYGRTHLRTDLPTKRHILFIFYRDAQHVQVLTPIVLRLT